MKDLWSVSLIVILTLALPSASFAHTNNGVEEGGVSSRVNIENDINTNSGYSSQTQTKTDIRIESNGEVKTYSSDKNENVDLESSDGKVKVKINNNDPGEDENSFKEDVNTEEKEESTEINGSVRTELKRHVAKSSLFQELADLLKGMGIL